VSASGLCGRSGSAGAGVAGLLMLLAAGAWLVTDRRMSGMDAGPGTDLGTPAWFAGAWLTMMAAMMLPSAAPAILVVAREARRRVGWRGPLWAWCFVAGYLAVWTASGIAAYGIDRLVVMAGPAWLGWDREGPYVAGAAIAAAGLYQLTPLKSACLRRCRGPLRFIVGRWRTGAGGAAVMGGEHGLTCLGCCLGLTMVLFAVGVMSVFWMAVVGAAVFAEKILPRPPVLARALALLLVGLGAWLALAPSSVPRLTDPRTTRMEMDVRSATGHPHHAVHMERDSMP